MSTPSATPTGVDARTERFRFSIRHMFYAFALIGFTFAASADEEYAVSTLLRSACVGVLIYGLGCQMADLWKARSAWRGATIAENRGWRRALLVRGLIAAGLVFSSFASPSHWLVSEAEMDYSEYNQRVGDLSDAFEPMMLICGLAMAPWCWRRAASPWRRALDGVIAFAALGALLAITWYSASFVTALVHIAINGVSLAQKIELDTISPARTPALMQFTREALAQGLAALALALAGGVLLYLRSRAPRGWMQLLLWPVVALALAASASQVLWLKHVAFPRVSPVIAGSVVETDPKLRAVIAGASLFIGVMAMLWMEIGRAPVTARRWRRAGWYPHEARFFYEVLLFSIAVEQVEVFRQIITVFREFGSLFAGDWEWLIRSVIGVFAGYLQQPMPMALLVLSLGGLFQRRKQAPDELSQTPAPASILVIVLGAPLGAACAYLIAESMLWSNFFYWISVKT